MIGSGQGPPLGDRSGALGFWERFGGVVGVGFRGLRYWALSQRSLESKVLTGGSSSHERFGGFGS